MTDDPVPHRSRPGPESRARDIPGPESRARDIPGRDVPATEILPVTGRLLVAPGAPATADQLRLLRVPFADFDGRTRHGELVVHADEAEAVAWVFGRLFEHGWPIRRMRPVEAYGGDDARSMADNNTSGFNCRRVAGTDRWSEHAYGRAVDLNPVQNPWVMGTEVQPESGREYASLDRSADAREVAGVIRADDVVVRAFRDIGWAWGGDWGRFKDYQHFSSSGR